MPSTVSGNLKDLTGTAVTSNSFVRFYLRGYGRNQPRVNGTALISPGSSGSWYQDFLPNASGVIAGTLYSTRDTAGTGAGEIQAGTSYTSVWYGMVVVENGNPGPEMPVHAKNGVTLDVNSVTPLTTTPVSTAPTGDTTYARLDGGNMPFTGPVGLTGKINEYAGISTVGNGVASEIAAVDLTAQGALVNTTALYAVPSSGSGQYRVSWNAKITRAASSSSQLGQMTIVYTDPDGVAQTISAIAQVSSGNFQLSETSNTTSAVLIGLPLLLNCKASTNITYGFSYSSTGATTMQYNLHLRLEAL